MVLVGAQEADISQGGVFVFSESFPTESPTTPPTSAPTVSFIYVWEIDEVATAPDATTSSYFGDYVDVLDNYLLAGSSGSSKCDFCFYHHFSVNLRQRESEENSYSSLYFVLWSSSWSYSISRRQQYWTSLRLHRRHPDKSLVCSSDPITSR